MKPNKRFHTFRFRVTLAVLLCGWFSTGAYAPLISPLPVSRQPIPVFQPSGPEILSRLEAIQSQDKNRAVRDALDRKYRILKTVAASA